MIKFRNAAMALVAACTFAAAVPASAAAPVHAPVAASEQWQNGRDDDDDDRWEHGRRHEWRGDRHYGRGHDRDYRRYDRGYYRGGDRGYYRQRTAWGEPVYRHTRVWRGHDGRAYCRRSDGTTGLLIGGAAGALIGRGVAGDYGDRTLGAILGAAGGALLGREIDRGGSSCR